MNIAVNGIFLLLWYMLSNFSFKFKYFIVFVLFFFSTVLVNKDEHFQAKTHDIFVSSFTTTSMSLLVIVGPKCTLAASRAGELR